MDKDYLIEKWLKNELTDAEKEAFEKLNDYQLHVDVLDHAKHFKASNFSDVDDFNTFKEAYQDTTPIKKIDWFKPMLRMASVLVIGFAIYFSFFYNNLTQIETLVNQKSTIQLPDNSQVTLNADSKLVYNKSNWENKRTLELDGEAYFKVAKGKTFDVVTSNGIVTVVGTEFNVKQRNDYFEVKCFEGIVRVTSDTITRQLLAGDTYRVLNTIFTQDKITYTVPQWTKNVSTFKAVPFSRVILEFERQYGVHVKVNNTDEKRLFSGGFTHNNIENALMSITEPMDLNYKISTPNQVVINGNKK
ncbi:FecR family protein [Ichthyenterobacterium magnum]|uniref:FecR family protein n=1 Tax=Ichthyenterobacterium magnum TaxID=1230530 RepID=A0A420DL78_9FLAO|nr:FecR family protein [Ichthyenterobacterium magnum]RKE94992.1 FecR family protein [Ichthyenterobacterium magnum]